MQRAERGRYREAACAAARLHGGADRAALFPRKSEGRRQRGERNAVIRGFPSPANADTFPPRDQPASRRISMSRRIGIALAFAALILAPGLATAQKLVQLKNQPPEGANVTYQLTDGTVLAQSGAENTWYRLTPDNTGSYVNGTWSQAATLPPGYVPLYFAGAVLADGRLVITGVEYNNGAFAFSNKGAVYDPVNNVWTVLKPPKGWTNIGDSPSSMLPDGRFLLGDKFFNKVAALNPKTLKWTELTSKGKNEKWFAEEGWVLLPTGHILTWDVKA